MALYQTGICTFSTFNLSAFQCSTTVCRCWHYLVPIVAIHFFLNVIHLFCFRWAHSPNLTPHVWFLSHCVNHVYITLCLCPPTDLSGASGSKPLKPQRSLPGTPVSITQYPVDLCASMEEKYKEIAEVKRHFLNKNYIKLKRSAWFNFKYNLTVLREPQSLPHVQKYLNTHLPVFMKPLMDWLLFAPGAVHSQHGREWHAKRSLRVPRGESHWTAGRATTPPRETDQPGH